MAVKQNLQFRLELRETLHQRGGRLLLAIFLAQANLTVDQSDRAIGLKPAATRGKWGGDSVAAALHSRASPLGTAKANHASLHKAYFTAG